jgi:drug/metabolite transporter (DMT)-like permease
MNPVFSAVLACVAHGLFGSLITVYMSEISARKVNPFSFYALSNLLGGLLAGCFLLFQPMAIPARLGLLTAVLGACGFTYVVALFVQIRCFAYGRRGIAAACITSANVIPFLFGILAMGERPGGLGYVGVVLLIVGMVTCAMTSRKKEESNSEEGTYAKWLGLLILCVALNGMGQIFQGLSSWLKLDDVPGMARAALLMLLSSLGNLLACLLTRHPLHHDLKPNLPWAAVWAIIGTGTNLMVFVAMDAMSRVGIGAMTFAISSSASLLFFLLYTAVRFRERYPLATLIGMALNVLGMVTIALAD